MKLIDDDIINLTEDEIGNIKKEYSINFIKNEKGYNFIIDFINNLDLSNLDKYEYYGKTYDFKKEDYINKIINDIIEDIYLESDNDISLASVILYKMFKSFNIIFVDSKKENIKFENDLIFEDEKSIYNIEGIKLGHMINLIPKNNGSIDDYYKVYYSHFDFIFFKLNDYRGIIFQNPYYKYKGAMKSNLNLEAKTKLKELLFDKNDISKFSFSDVSMDYYVESLNKKQIEYINNLGNHKDKLSKNLEKYININKKFEEDEL